MRWNAGLAALAFVAAAAGSAGAQASPHEKMLHGDFYLHPRQDLRRHVIQGQGKLMLGRWQGVYFIELDGPRSRKVTVYV